MCSATKQSACENGIDALPNEAWQAAQTKLWKKKGIEIYKKASEEKRDILFMIHGFNNYPSSASRNFSLIKDKVKLIERKKIPLFVEVYWDGFTGLPLSGAWSSAQASGPLVGFQLRQLLKSIQYEYGNSGDPLPDLMFITHSSGAFVAGSLLGNPYSALPLLHDESKEPSAEYIEFKAKKDGKDEKYPIPSFPEIRLGMIAAATSSNTFTGSPNVDNNVEGGILSSNTKLTFTINWKDSALTKYVGLMNVNPTGATGSGQDEDHYCLKLATIKGQSSKAFDLSEGGFLFWNSHSLDSYLGRENINDFIKSVLGYDTQNQIKCI